MSKLTITPEQVKAITVAMENLTDMVDAPYHVAHSAQMTNIYALHGGCEYPVVSFNFATNRAVFGDCYGVFKIDARVAILNAFFKVFNSSFSASVKADSNGRESILLSLFGEPMKNTMIAGERFVIDFSAKVLEVNHHGVDVLEGYGKPQNKVATRNPKDKIIITDEQYSKIQTQVGYGAGLVTIGEIDIEHNHDKENPKDSYITAVDKKTRKVLCVYSRKNCYLVSQPDEALTPYARQRLLNAFLDGLNWDYILLKEVNDGWEGYMLDSPYVLGSIANDIDFSGAICLDGKEDTLTYAAWKDGKIETATCHLYFDELNA